MDKEYINHLEAIVKYSEDAYISRSLDGTIRSWNEGSEQMFGYTSKEMIGKNISLIIPPEFANDDKSNLKRIFNSERVDRYETIRIKKNGEKLHVSMIVSDLKDKEGNITGFYQVVRDITDKKKSEAELIEANKELAFQNEEKGKRAAELFIANKELAFQNTEKENRASELLIANKKLVFENEEKEKRAAELIIANKELAFQNNEKHKRAEELLIANKELDFLNKKQQALFASIVNSSDDAMLSKTLDGIITSWNYGAEKIFGYSADEIIGKNVLTLIPPHLQQEEVEISHKIRKGETINNYETKRLRKNGTIFYASFTISPIRNFDGDIIGASKVLHDITEQKKADVEKKRLAERLLLATKSANMGIWDWDIENNTLLWDEGMNQLYGIVANEFISLYEGWLSRLYDEDRQRVNNDIQLAIENKKDYNTEFRIVWGDSSIHYLKATGIVERDNEGNARRMIGANWDITSQKEKEQHLKLLESVITNTTDSVLITEAEPFDEPGNRIVYVNEAFTKMTGYTSAEVIGKSPRILQGPKSDKNELKRLSETIRKWQPFETSIINYRKNGEEFWINFSLTPVANEKGWYTHWIAIERDVTEQKLAEIQLKELNKTLQNHAKELALSNIELEQFAYVASHDLQEPLRMITSFLTQIEKKYGDVIDNKGKKYIGFAVDGAKRMRQIILDLLEYSRIGRTEEDKEELDLNELIDEIKLLLKKKIEEKKAVFIIDQLPHIHAYRPPIRQVFQNLISNALKYSKNVIPAQIHIAVAELENHWQFAVIDNGIGIEKEYFDKIFIIFQRLHNKEKYSGTGMGLAITKKIVETQGGTIWVESEEGKGSTFYFTIKK